LEEKAKEVETKKTIFVVDDTKLQRLVVTSLLEKLGFHVIEAVNGQEALDLLHESAPDLILMDIEMPVMNGIEATRHIRQREVNHHTPIIFITGLNDEKSFQACMEAGGDDFIAKPINQVVLGSKIKSLLRFSDLLSEQEAHRARLERVQNETLREQQVAADIFRKIVHAGNLDADNIKYFLSPMSLFNGDLLLAAYTPTGQLQLMLGDFTGHGLVASIGAGPAAEIFYGMTAKGFAIEDIVSELNQKMCKVLPTGMFLAACLLSFDKEQALISLFTGGLPEHLLFSEDSGEIDRVTSSNLPLGIIDNEQSDFVFEHREVSSDQRLYLFTDGIVESRNKKGKEAGIEGIEWCIANPVIKGDVFNSILESHKRFTGSSDQEDDLTLVEINFDQEFAIETAATPARMAKPPATWETSISMAKESLKSVNPVPMVVNQLMELQGLQSYKEAIYTIVTELYVNALDHGVLGLDSSIKIDAEGFMRYFSLREERLAALKKGRVKISFKHLPTTAGGRLTILIQDSGDGFDETTVGEGLEGNKGYSGRGIALVRKLCSSLNYSDNGRRAKAVFDWEYTG
jgi:CheY-like chemotaxis protein